MTIATSRTGMKSNSGDYRPANPPTLPARPGADSHFGMAER
jgi:hypothetical protein